MVFNTCIALMLMELNVFQAHRPGAGPVLQHRHQLDDGGGGRPGDQQADGLVAARASSSSARTCTTSTRWAWARWAQPRCCPSRPTSARSGRWRRHSRRASPWSRPSWFAADRVGDPGPLLHRPPARRGPAGRGQLQAPDALRDLRARLRARRHGALPRLPGRHLLAVLLARRALPRPVQAAGAAVGAVATRRCRASCPPACGAGSTPSSATTCMLMALGMPALAALFYAVYRLQRGRAGRGRS